MCGHESSTSFLYRTQHDAYCSAESEHFVDMDSGSKIAVANAPNTGDSVREICDTTCKDDIEQGASWTRVLDSLELDGFE